MPHRITEDERRFKKIADGKVRKNLRKHMSYPDQIIRKGGKKVVIPFPQVCAKAVGS